VAFLGGTASCLLRLFAAVICLIPVSPSLAQSDSSISSRPARSSPEWLKGGVIYQIFVRSFSHEGTLSGVTSRLDELHNSGVNILWLMPIHPDGQVNNRSP
jgi:hypothetical protein